MDRGPSSDEAAAIAAAVERFQAETAPQEGTAPGELMAPWQRAALVEGAGTKAAIQKHQEGGVKWLS